MRSLVFFVPLVTAPYLGGALRAAAQEETGLCDLGIEVARNVVVFVGYRGMYPLVNGKNIY